MQDLKSELISGRNAIRKHRDQLGDYRCWVDDEVLYAKVLPEYRGRTILPPPPEEFFERCRLYHEQRQDPLEPNDIPIPLDSRVAELVLNYNNQELDADIQLIPESQLSEILTQLQQDVRTHYSLGYQRRTFESDRALYLTLPEKLVAKTKLPPRELFLGRGCPDYNEYCQGNPHDFIEGIWNPES